MTAEQIAIENARAFRRLVDELERNVPELPEHKEARKRDLADILERLHCSKAGQPGHTYCGSCETHRTPRVVCGCRFVAK